jgi:hypothetical protein
MTQEHRHPSMSRRTALAGLGAGGLGVAVAAHAAHASAQGASADMATHPVVGLWQFNGTPDPALGPQPGFETYHADGTYFTWGGLNTGCAQGLWRPTGDRTAEVLWVAIDTDPFPGGTEARGTATFHFTLEVNDADTTLTYSAGTLDVRDSYGTPLFPAGPFESPASTRVTFGVNPATGSTVTEMPATPDAGTPTS